QTTRGPDTPFRGRYCGSHERAPPPGATQASHPRILTSPAPTGDDLPPQYLPLKGLTSGVLLHLACHMKCNRLLVLPTHQLAHLLEDGITFLAHGPQHLSGWPD